MQSSTPSSGETPRVLLRILGHNDTRRLLSQGTSAFPEVDAMDERARDSVLFIDAPRSGGLSRLHELRQALANRIIIKSPSLSSYHAALFAAVGSPRPLASAGCGGPRSTSLLIASLACTHFRVYGAIYCSNKPIDGISEGDNECQLLQVMSDTGLACAAPA